MWPGNAPPVGVKESPMQIRLWLLLAVVAGSVGCGSVSGLKRESGATTRIADYRRVEVLDFNASGGEKFPDAAKQAEYDASLLEARRKFADKIAEAITATGSFDEVSRQPLASGALRVSGDITRYDEGNIVARGLTGFAGETHFEAVVVATDAATGRQIATLNVDRNSWPLPIGASASTLQTTNFFMEGAAKKVAAELLAARPREGGK
jgi:hypothetical protein